MAAFSVADPTTMEQNPLALLTIGKVPSRCVGAGGMKKLGGAQKKTLLPRVVSKSHVRALCFTFVRACAPHAPWFFLCLPQIARSTPWEGPRANLQAQMG